MLLASQSLPLQPDWRLHDMRELRDEWRATPPLSCRALFQDLELATDPNSARLTERATSLVFPADYDTASVFFGAMDAGRVQVNRMK